MNDDRDLTVLLAGATRASVDDVVAGPGFVSAVQRRANRQRYGWLGAAAAVLVLVVAVAGVAAVLRDDGSQLATAPTTHARYLPGSLPEGFDPNPIAEENGSRPGEPGVWASEARYGRSAASGPADPRLGVLMVETLSGEVAPVTLATAREREPGARAVRVGDREVIRLRNMPRTIIVYAWTDQDGNVVSVTGLGPVDDADVREFLLSLRRQDVPAST